LQQRGLEHTTSKFSNKQLTTAPKMSLVAIFGCLIYITCTLRQKKKAKLIFNLQRVTLTRILIIAIAALHLSQRRRSTSQHRPKSFTCLPRRWSEIIVVGASSRHRHHKTDPKSVSIAPSKSFKE
jgi:hypothetical protein